ncbi:MAG TPA: hypothetical protein VHO06_09470 [Polyangia bacterium]|nr:hypothetical protein [Polyangia bacterium]
MTARAGVIVVIVSGLLVACERRPQSSAPSVSTTEPAPAPAAAKTPVLLLALAAFKNDELVECDDLEGTGQIKPGADIKAASDQLWGAFKKPKDSTVVTTRLQRKCSEQFQDRKPFAVCSNPLMVKDVPGLHVRISHYSFANVFRTDGLMRECMQLGGEWSAMSRTSDEFREAELRFDTLEAQKQVKTLMRQAQ